MIAGRAATIDDDRSLPIRTAACIDICVSSTRRRASRTAMSIPKKGGKRANTEPQKAKDPEGSVVPRNRTRNPRVQVVIDFMNTNLQRSISLSELADLANLSRSHLCRLFKSQTGLSPGEYLRRLRMEKARELLSTSVLSIKQIMAMAGYNSKSHFVHHFRRSFDVAPSEYRRKVSS